MSFGSNSAVQFSQTTTHHTYTDEEGEGEEDEKTESTHTNDTYNPNGRDDENSNENQGDTGVSQPLKSRLPSAMSKRNSPSTSPARRKGRGQMGIGKGTSKAKMLQRSFSLVPERLNGRSDKPLVDPRPLQCCEFALQVLMIACVLLTFPFSLVFCLQVIPQYERAVVFRLGRIMSTGPMGPGLIFVLPCLDVVKRVDLRTFTFDVPTQEVLTKDSVTVAVDAVVYYRMFDPVMSVVNVEDANRSTKLLAQTTLRNVLGTVDLSQLLTDRIEIAAMMQETLDVATDTWGVKVERVEVKDVRLPQMLQRAMAAEAEATREARAKVIAAEGEHQAAKPLTLAAKAISECNIALQLRYLQTLNSISAEKNSTIVFPVPVDIVRHFMPTTNFPPTSSVQIPCDDLPPPPSPLAPPLPPRSTNFQTNGDRSSREKTPIDFKEPSAPSDPALTGYKM